ncbi:5'/3'-nucleotidase SurE [Temperatibacter marinus]|uniref:5'-nucleotidase SurE n=1 Tax=Temperatibacter marinus TaxID=1456591 RepID=A0AA52EIE8_9PROT|nr:5'/3'-nucleotidase SurE [Temperatibacter marinus]WND02621.1 5'/3'-nucleotidase SurE [Temperatibacter marinus]
MISCERILVSNDDGISAEGMALLVEVAHELSDDVWIVAPDGEQSGASHSLTLSRPLRLRKHGDKKFSVSGTPTDCVMMALNHVMKDQRPTLVLSGVNRGANMAEDITYSGTCSVAMEGTLAGIPSIALSQQLSPERDHRWEPTKEYCLKVIKRLLPLDWDKGTFYNVNFPPCRATEVKGMRLVAHGHREATEIKIHKAKDPRGFSYYWLGLGGRDLEYNGDSDLGTVTDNYIAITPVHLELTEYEALKRQKASVDQDF